MDDFLTLDRQLCFAIYETSSQFSKLYSTVLADFNLTYPQYLVLLALWDKDGIGVTSIGEKINLGTGTLTPILSRMEKSGWLRKERSQEDERKVIVHLEAKATDQKNSITEAVQEKIINCHISIDEYDQLMKQLKQLQEKLKHAKQTPLRNGSDH